MRYLYFIIALFIFSGCSSGQNSNERRDYVFDRARVLSIGEVDKLDYELRELEDSVGSQLVVLIIDSLGMETIEAYSLRIATEWGIGRKDINDGVLITMSMQDRRMRIEVGYGLEKILRDEIAAKFIRDEMTPSFKEEKYFEGLFAAIIQIKALIYENRELIGKSP